MELLPSLHRRLKEKALADDRKLYEVVQEAFEAYLGETVKAKPQRRIPARLRHYVELMEDILESGDDAAIRSATVAVDYAHEQLRPADESQKRR
jgi:hypothetical protein